MKNQILILILLALESILNAQSKKIEQIEYSKDSIPSLIVFNKNETKYKQTEGITIIKENLNLSNDDNFISIKSFTDNIGYSHVRFQHYYKGLKVEFSQYDVHSMDNQITSISGTLRKIKSLNTKPILTEIEALSVALKYVNAEEYMWENHDMEKWLKKEKHDDFATYYPKGDLVIWTDLESDKIVLSYKFDIFSQIPLNHNFVYVDACNGKIIDIQGIMKSSASIGIAATRYSSSQHITTDYRSDTYFYLYDPTRFIETRDMNKCTIIANSVSFMDDDNAWADWEYDNPNWDNAALDAHFSAEKTYDYFLQPFIGRHGWDGDNTLLKLYAHYDVNWCNSAWDPSANYIILGDGDGGVTYNPWTDLDAVSHEYAHGISDDEVGLNYNGEPGALDEGLSDIWAACVESYAALPNHNIWVMFDNIEVSGFHNRNIQNPGFPYHYHLYNYPSNPPTPYPNTYGGTGWYTGDWDGHGRHLNSTVLSHWFYLLSQGGTGTNDNGQCYNVSSIGITDAAKIVYYMETVYLTSNSTFANARTYSIQAAFTLFGPNSNQLVQTTNAWHAVGVGNKYQPYILGPTLICSSENYYVNNPPIGATITWSTSSPNIAFVPGQQNSNPCTFQKVSSGNAIINASVTSLCENLNLSFVVHSGYYSSSDYPISGPSSAQCKSYVYYAIPSLPDATLINWTWPSTWTYISGQGTYYLALKTGNSSGGVAVGVNNRCGQSGSYAFKYTSVYGSCGYSLIISPNPASNEITISINDSSSLIEEGDNSNSINLKSQYIESPTPVNYVVRIYNNQGSLLSTFKRAGKTFTIPLANLSNGIYIVEVDNGIVSDRKQLIVQQN